MAQNDAKKAWGEGFNAQGEAMTAALETIGQNETERLFAISVGNGHVGALPWHLRGGYICDAHGYVVADGQTPEIEALIVVLVNKHFWLERAKLRGKTE